MNASPLIRMGFSDETSKALSLAGFLLPHQCLAELHSGSSGVTNACAAPWEPEKGI